MIEEERLQHRRDYFSPWRALTLGVLSVEVCVGIVIVLVVFELASGCATTQH